MPQPADIPITLSNPSIDISQPTECPIPLGTLEDSFHESDGELVDSIASCIPLSNTRHIPNDNEPGNSSRPQRIRKRPNYLKDYVQ